MNQKELNRLIADLKKSHIEGMKWFTLGALIIGVAVGGFIGELLC